MPFESIVQALLNAVDKAPDADAIETAHSSIPYEDLVARILQITTHLLDLKLERGARVALLSPNDVNYIAAYFGTLSAGHVVVPLNFQEKPVSIANVLKHADARVLIVSERYPSFDRLAQSPDVGDMHVVQIDGQREKLAGKTVLKLGHMSRSSLFNTRSLSLGRNVRRDSLASIVYTSGTTGSPKGVMLSHENLAANTASILSYLPIDSSCRALNLLPFYYAFGNSIMLTHLVSGSTLILEDNVAFPAKVIQRISSSKATCIYGVPTTFRMLFNTKSGEQADLARLMHRVSFLAQAGGSMPVSQQRALSKILPDVRIFVMYGQTEATARLTYLEPNQIQNKAGSVGKAIPGVEILVEDTEDGRATPDRPGEICAKGKNIMMGYWRNEDASRSVLKDGWLRTGDLGYLDSDGYLYLVGRSSEMIKTGANRVSPLEVEEVVGAVPGVQSVAAFAVSDDILGQAIAIAVVGENEEGISAASLKRHCLQNLASYKVPKYVFYVDELPVSTTGKILRRKLTSEYEEAIARDT